MATTIDATMQVNRVFREANKSKRRYIVMKGSAGSGKSVDTAQHYIVRLMQNPGRNLLVVRKSEVTNRDSTFAELVGAVNRLGVGKLWRITYSPLQLKFVTGNKVIFRGMNDSTQREKLKSITFDAGGLTDIWVEEATELTREDIDILDDRLRGILPSGLFYQMRLTFNPVSASHWIKKNFFDKADDNVFTHHSTYLDNRFVDEAYHARMERRKELDPDGYRVYGLGEWGTLSGQILTNFEVCKVSRNTEDYDDVAIGQDFGFNHANAILTLGFKDGDIFILGEIYVHEKDTAEIIALANVAKISKKRVMWCDSAEPDRIKTWRKAGYAARAVSKEQGSVQAQIDWLKKRRIFVHPSCVKTIEELEQWRWAYDDKRGEFLDMPIAFKDDAMAALRYGIEGQRKARKMTGIKL